MVTDIAELEFLDAEDGPSHDLTSCHFTWTGTTADTLCNPNGNTEP